MLHQIIEQSLQFEYYAGILPDDSPSGASTGWRSLPFSVFSYVVKGQFCLHVPGQPTPVPIVPGGAVFVPRGLAHKIDVGPRRSWGAWCHLNYTIMGTVDFFSLIDLPPVMSPRLAAEPIHICRELLSLQTSRDRDPLWRASRTKALGFQLLTQLIGIAKPKPGYDQFLVRGRTLEPVLQYIQRHLAEPLTIDKLARVAGCSRSGFHQFFKEVMDVSPRRFVQEQRVRAAQLLLHGSDLRVSEIGQRVGYPDPFHFSRAFKSLCGMSPTRFRENRDTGLWARSSS